MKVKLYGKPARGRVNPRRRIVITQTIPLAATPFERSFIYPQDIVVQVIR
jgi:hypothetical protein